MTGGGRLSDGETYQEAEQACWDSEDMRYVRLETLATARMVESRLRKTELTPEHRELGWSEETVRFLASMSSEL
jgi:hypothetical protein